MVLTRLPSGIGQVERVLTIAQAEQKEPTVSNQVKLINRHQKLMVGSAIGGVVVIGLFVLLLPNPFSGMNKLQAYCFYLGIVCLLLGFHSALRALTVEPTNVIYLQASSAWWSQTAVTGSSVAFLWVHCLPLPFLMLSFLSVLLMVPMIMSATASRRLVETARRAQDSAGSAYPLREAGYGERGQWRCFR